MLALAGDDHGAKSSTLPHQSDHIFKACGLPVFYPSTVQEYLDLGLHGWAMSRWSGLWVAMKTVTEAIQTVRRRCDGPKSCVKWMKNGTQASGLTIANSVIRGLRSMDSF